MSYSNRAKFDEPAPAEAERSRRIWLWLGPLLVLQQASQLVEPGASFGRHVYEVAWWCALTLAILWMLAGWPVPWMSKRERIILNDEGQRAMRADAMHWGMVVAVIIGCGMMVASLWMDLSTGAAINGLVSTAIITAGVRFAWLNRADRGEDE